MAEKRGPKQKAATREEFARLMGISHQAVTEHVRKNVLTRGAPLARWLVEYGKHHAAVSAGWQSKDGSIDRIQEAALLDRTKREEIEMRMAEKRGTLIPDDVFIDGVGETFTAVKTRLLSIPNRLRSRRPNLSAEDIGAVEDEVRDTLTELSDDRFPRDIRMRLETERSHVPAGAAANGQRVGGRKRKLSSESSPEPGQWKTADNPLHREIIDCFSNPLVETTVVKASGQFGKTEDILNVAGYHIENDPAPILIVRPTEDEAKAFSKDRLAAMLRDTPSLQDLVLEPRVKGSDNTLFHKKFHGGHVTITWSESQAGVASRPIRICLCDEIDLYTVDAVSKAIKRTVRFWNRKIGLIQYADLYRHLGDRRQVQDQRPALCACAVHALRRVSKA